MPRRLVAWATETKVIGFLLSCGTCNKNESRLSTSWENAQQLCREKAREASQENSPEDSQDFSWEGQVAQHRGLAGFRAAATMIIAGPILMGAPKDRPLADQGSGSGRRPEEVGQQMTGFRGGERDERRAG